MTAIGGAAGKQRERLRNALDGYAASDIAAMLEAHSPGAGAARRKSERIDQLVRILADPEFIRRAVSLLTPLGRSLLAVAARAERISLSALFLAGENAEGDEPPVRRELEALLRRGLLLIDDRETPGRGELSLVEPVARLRWVWTPAAVREALPSPLELVPAPPPTEREPAKAAPGSFAQLRRDLYLAIRFLKTSGIRCTRVGEPHRTDLRKLQAALSPGQAPPRRAGSDALDSRLLFLVRLLEATGAARETGGMLRVGPGTDALLNQTEVVAARALYEAWLDLDWDEFRRLTHLTIEPWSYAGPGDVPQRPQLARARRSLAAALATLPDAWVSVDALAALLRRTDPEFLVPRMTDPAAATNAYYSAHASYYQSWQVQEQGFYRGFARTEARGRDRRLRKDRDWTEVEGAFIAQVVGEPLRWLGLVDAGYDAAAARTPDSADSGGLRGRGEAELPAALRLTALGRQVLTGDLVAAPGAPAGNRLIVQPNFEVLVLDALADFELLAALDAFADPVSVDRAAIYRLSRPALVRGLDAGWSEERIIALLEGESGAPLPQNVRHTLHGWAAEYDRIHVHRDATLLEAPDRASLDRWLAQPDVASLLGRRLTPTAALVRASSAEALEAALLNRGVEVWTTDYALDAPRVLDYTGPDRVAVWPEDDEPYLRYRLDRFADRQPGRPDQPAPGPAGERRLHYRITRTSLARARQHDLSIDEILSFLRYKSRTSLTADDVLTLRGWAGYYPPFHYLPVRAVELPPTVNWGELGRIKALRPLIYRVLSASLALVIENSWPRFRDELAARGIVLDELPPPPPMEEGAPSPAQRAAGSLGLATARELLNGHEPRQTLRDTRRPALKKLAGRALLDFIEEALDSEAPLLIEYRNQRDRRPTKRVIEPREVEASGGAQYLRAFCRLRQEERNFRLSGILGVALAEE